MLNTVLVHGLFYYLSLRCPKADWQPFKDVPSLLPVNVADRHKPVAALHRIDGWERWMDGPVINRNFGTISRSPARQDYF